MKTFLENLYYENLSFRKWLGTKVSRDLAMAVSQKKLVEALLGISLKTSLKITNSLIWCFYDFYCNGLNMHLSPFFPSLNLPFIFKSETITFLAHEITLKKPEYIPKELSVQSQFTLFLFHGKNSIACPERQEKIKA